MSSKVQAQQPLRAKIRELIQGVSNKAFKKEGISTFLYGSVEQGIGIDTSDMDIAITGIHCLQSNDILIQH